METGIEALAVKASLLAGTITVSVTFLLDLNGLDNNCIGKGKEL